MPTGKRNINMHARPARTVLHDKFTGSRGYQNTALAKQQTHPRLAAEPAANSIYYQRGRRKTATKQQQQQQQQHLSNSKNTIITAATSATPSAANKKDIPSNNIYARQLVAKNVVWKAELSQRDLTYNELARGTTKPSKS